MPPADSRPPLTPGTLYLVATPIGNLEDITLRALRVLRECTVIAAEDTRHTGQLLKHFDLHKPLVSCFHFNEARRDVNSWTACAAATRWPWSPMPAAGHQRSRRARGQRALAAGLRVAVPGPCALIAGLTISGLPTDEFHFVGFLPHKAGQRQRRLDRLQTVPGTLVFYESPFRIERLLTELREVFPERQVVLARELTKKFEERRQGTPEELLATLRQRPPKGEFVVLVSPA